MKEFISPKLNCSTHSGVLEWNTKWIGFQIDCVLGSVLISRSKYQGLGTTSDSQYGLANMQADIQIDIHTYRQTLT